MKGYGVGAMQGGVTLIATCSPFDAIPPSVWDGFKKLVMEGSKQWGLSVHFSEHPSIQDGKNEFWRQQRVSQEAAERLVREKGPANGG